ncbi:MAG: hypothetical protein ACFFCY_17525 [Promethearchaeota archaeon]
MSIIKVFSVNEFISLKLEEELIIEVESIKKFRTNIYIKDEKFAQCSFLLIEIPIEEITSLNKISSIDEVEEKLDNSLEELTNNLTEYKITPETEFWGHCSNIQVWVENNYNSKLLHRSLAFPLLKKLTDVGDLLARKVFREEIASRFASCHLQVIHFLMFEHYLDYLSEEELDVLFNEVKIRNKLLFFYLEPILMIKGYIKYNLTDKEFKRYLNSYASELETGKFVPLNIPENLKIEHQYTIRKAISEL